MSVEVRESVPLISLAGGDDAEDGTRKPPGAAPPRPSLLERLGGADGCNFEALVARPMLSTFEELNEHGLVLRACAALLVFFFCYSLYFGLHEMNEDLARTVFLMAQTLTTVRDDDLRHRLGRRIRGGGGGERGRASTRRRSPS